MSKVVLSPAAKQDLLDIWLYIADGSVTAADRAIDGITERCRDLARHPLAGEAEPDLDKNLRSSPTGIGDYIIFYRPRSTGNGIEVARVLHGMRDLRELL